MKINAMVIDDSRAILGVMRTILESQQVNHIDCCDTGTKALQLLEKHKDKYHILFVDLNMPGMDGIEFIYHLSQHGFKGGIAIISAMDDRVIKLAAEITRQRHVHLVGCVNKPITEENISYVLEKLAILFSVRDEQSNPLDFNEMCLSIKEQRLIPYYQPKIDSKDGRVHGFEVLARISMPGSTDSILPGRFIGVAEKNNYIDKITYHLFNIALEQFNHMLETMRGPCKLAINISPLMLNTPGLPDQLSILVNKHDVKAEDIILEITEHCVIETTIQLETLNRLRLKGFGLSLDDFGTGFTNLQQLMSLPYTEIKIDRSLIYNIAQDKLSQVVVKSLLDISQQLELDLIAEGVENEEDLNYLGKLNKSFYLQGFIISKPKPLDSVFHWYSGWNKSLSIAS